MVGGGGLVVIACFGFLLFFVFRTKKYGIDASNPRELHAGGARYRLHSITGQVVHYQVTREHTTYERRELATGYLQNRWSVTTVLYDLTVQGRNNAIESFTVADAGLALLKGQLVTVVWPIKSGQTKGWAFMVRNHSTNRINYVPQAMKALCYPSAWPAVIVLLLGVPLVFLAIFPATYFLATNQTGLGMLILALSFLPVPTAMGILIMRSVNGRRRIAAIESDLATVLVPQLDQAVMQGSLRPAV